MAAAARAPCGCSAAWRSAAGATQLDAGGVQRSRGCIPAAARGARETTQQRLRPRQRRGVRWERDAVSPQVALTWPLAPPPRAVAARRCAPRSSHARHGSHCARRCALPQPPPGLRGWCTDAAARAFSWRRRRLQLLPRHAPAVPRRAVGACAAAPRGAGHARHWLGASAAAWRSPDPLAALTARARLRRPPGPGGHSARAGGGRHQPPPVHAQAAGGRGLPEAGAAAARRARMRGLVLAASRARAAWPPAARRRRSGWRW